MINDYLKLMKPHVIWLLVLSAVVGYIAAAPSINLVKLVELTVVGFLSTGGSAAFNMYYERDIDSLMTRTMTSIDPVALDTSSITCLVNLSWS